MLKKFKIWIYNNFHLITGLVLAGSFFYLALMREWFLVFFFLIFFFLNVYFAKGAKLVLSTFLAPLPFLLSQSFFNLNHIYLALIWLGALVLLWKNEKIFWLLDMFLILIIFQFVLGNVILQPFFVVLLTFLSVFLVILIIFRETTKSAFVKSFIVSELVWLLYFLPVGFIIRAIINFIGLYFILCKIDKEKVAKQNGVI
jgi:hypothetical protein